MTISIETHEAGVSLDLCDQRAVLDLFGAAYYRYHYFDDIDRLDRIRFLARTHDGALVGFCAAEQFGMFYKLSNLLVDRRARGQGIGRRLEYTRLRYVRHTGLGAYVSCACDTPASQRLKLEFGLLPIGARYGYRVNVTAPGVVGSSIVFVDRIGLLGTAEESVMVDPKNERARVIFDGSTDLVEQLSVFPSDWYVDVLSQPEVIEGVDLLAPAGIDIDLTDGSYLYCHQLKNDRYNMALTANPTIICFLMRPEDVC